MRPRLRKQQSTIIVNIERSTILANACVLRKMMISFQTLISLFQPQPSVLFCSFAESDRSPPAPHCEIMCLCENKSRSKLFLHFCFLDQPRPSLEKNRSSLVCSDCQPGDVYVSGCTKTIQMFVDNLGR